MGIPRFKKKIFFKLYDATKFVNLQLPQGKSGTVGNTQTKYYLFKNTAKFYFSLWHDQSLTKKKQNKMTTINKNYLILYHNHLFLIYSKNPHAPSTYLILISGNI